MSAVSSLSELLAQKAELERRISQAQREERDQAVAEVRRLMDQHGLTLADLSMRAAAAKKGRAAGGKVAAKYRHPETGESWSGRGLQPNWLKKALASGKSLADFAVG